MLRTTHDYTKAEQRERERLQEQISRESIVQFHAKHEEKSLVPRLIAQYLAHEGYVETAKLFGEEVHAISMMFDKAGALSHLLDYREDTDAVKRQGQSLKKVSEVFAELCKESALLCSMETLTKPSSTLRHITRSSLTRTNTSISG